MEKLFVLHSRELITERQGIIMSTTACENTVIGGNFAVTD
jgi:hypothetical protein